MLKYMLAVLLAFSLSSCVIVRDSQNVEVTTEGTYKVGI